MSKIIKMPSLQEQVYSYLKKAIVNGEMELGQVYSEQWVADLLGVSRTPVREAILQLKQESLLEILPYKGFIVKPLSLDEVKETFQIRQALEGFCVIMIAQQHQDPLVAKLLAQLNDYLEEQSNLTGDHNVYEFMELDELYHRDIINFAGNERLISTYNEIRSRFQRITVKALKEPGRMEDTVREHLDILVKMKDGHPWEAYQTMALHLNSTQKIMESKTISNPPKSG